MCAFPCSFQHGLDEGVLLPTCRQVFGAALTFVGPLLGRDLSQHQQKIQKCSLVPGNKATDMTYAVIFYVAFAAVAFFLFVPLFHPKYKRTMEEKKAKQKSSPKVHTPTTQATQELNP